MKICVTTIYDDNMLDIANITAFDNFEKYCRLNNYQLEVIKIDYKKERHTSWCKILEVKKLLESNKYDWVFFIDLDCLFMNMTTKLESLVDDNNFIIFASNDDVQDYPVLNKFGTYGVAGSQFLIKNCQLSIDFLDDVWKSVDLPTDIVDEYDWEQRQFRHSIVKDKFKDSVKIIEGRLINAYWYTNDVFFLMKYKKYNKDIWQIGDFIVHIPGLHGKDRLKLISDLNFFSGGYIARFKRNNDILTISSLIDLNNIRVEISDMNNNLLFIYNFEEMSEKTSYWMSVLQSGSFIFRAYNENNEMISAKIID